MFATLALVGTLAQLLAPAIAAAEAAPVDSATVPAPTPAPAPPSIEDRYWAQLVRACVANAQHVRLHTQERVYERVDVELEAEGILLSGRARSSRSIATDFRYPEYDRVLAWNEITKVEVRNKASVAEGAAAGGIVGAAIAVPIALSAAVAAAIGSVFTFQSQDSNSGGIFLAAIAVGALLGAAAGHHRNGGWATCCERDSLAAPVPATSVQP